MHVCCREGEEAKDGEADAEAEDQGPAEMTLDEYKAQLNKQKRAAEFKLRKAGEGVDDKQWKDTFVLKKKVEEQSDEEEEEEEYEVSSGLESLFQNFDNPFPT